jgi:hypothetical protein
MAQTSRSAPSAGTGHAHGAASPSSCPAANTSQDLRDVIRENVHPIGMMLAKIRAAAKASLKRALRFHRNTQCPI